MSQHINNGERTGAVVSVVTDQKIPTRKLRYDVETGGMVEKRQSEPFLKGPIPISWLNRAACLPGKAINVALAIRWLSDMNNGKPIKLTRKALEFFSVSPDAASDAIRRLECEGLIKVERHLGQRPMIKMLPVINGSHQ